MSSFISEVGAAMVTGGRVAAERGREEDRADDEGRDPTATRLSRCESCTRRFNRFLFRSTNSGG